MFRHLLQALSIVSLALAGTAVGQPPPDYGFTWRTVGAPGNRPANEQEAPRLYPPFSTPALAVGAVGYSYRITQTEVTAGAWLQFLNAYWPYYDGFYGASALTSVWIVPLSTVPGQNPNFQLDPANVNKPVSVSWRNAARYVNWLNSNQGTAREAFETGAYDTSTFTQNADGTYNDQPTHTPSARYWIPTLDESAKALYYDPNKYGLGLEGYWLFPTSSDTPPIPGFPGQGGQTSAGIPFGSGPYLDVGSYQSIVSPWGLLDGSGSVSEWTELFSSARERVYRGTSQFGSDPALYDRLDVLLQRDPLAGGVAFRLAGAVPCPSGALLFLASAATVATRRRTCCSDR